MIQQPLLQLTNRYIFYGLWWTYLFFCKFKYVCHINVKNNAEWEKNVSERDCVFFS
jgi:hypothetical protein